MEVGGSDFVMPEGGKGGHLLLPLFIGWRGGRGRRRFNNTGGRDRGHFLLPCVLGGGGEWGERNLGWEEVGGMEGI